MDQEIAMRDNLIILSRAYAKATGLKLSTISTRIAGDSRFFENLSKPKPGGFTIRIYLRAIEKFKSGWPPETAMPQIWEPELPAKRMLRR